VHSKCQRTDLGSWI